MNRIDCIQVEELSTKTRLNLIFFSTIPNNIALLDMFFSHIGQTISID